jgi:hypothetical protein
MLQKSFSKYFTSEKSVEKNVFLTPKIFKIKYIFQSHSNPKTRKKCLKSTMYKGVEIKEMCFNEL